MEFPLPVCKKILQRCHLPRHPQLMELREAMVSWTGPGERQSNLETGKPKDSEDEKPSETHTIPWISWILMTSLPGKRRGFCNLSATCFSQHRLQLCTPAKVCSVSTLVLFVWRWTAPSSPPPEDSFGLSQWRKRSLYWRCSVPTFSLGTNALQAVYNPAKHPGNWLNFLL